MHACDHKAWFCECHHFLMTIPMGYCCALRPLRPLASIYLWLIGTKSCPSNKGRVQRHINKGFQCEIWCLGLLCDKKKPKSPFFGCFNTIFASVGPFSGVTRCFMVQIDPLYIKNRYIGRMSTRGACLWSLVLVLPVLPLFEGYPHGIILCC